MKHLLKFTALLTATLMCWACSEKESPTVAHERVITYTITSGDPSVDQRNPSGETTTVHLKTEAEFDALLDRFCDYAESGSLVSFYNADRTAKGHAAKEATTFSTTDREQMKAWMREMEDLGKTVTVTYDSATGTYSGRAYAGAPQPGSELITYQSIPQQGGFRYIMSFDTVNLRAYITLHDDTQWQVLPDYIAGTYDYRHADEVNTPFAYWFIDSEGDTMGLYILRGLGDDTLNYNTNPLGYAVTLTRTTDWQAYLSNDLGFDIIMHVNPNLSSTTERNAIVRVDVQTSVNSMDAIQCEMPFPFGRFLMAYPGGTQPGSGTYVHMALYQPAVDGAYSFLRDLVMMGDPGIDDSFTIIDYSEQACNSYYTFSRL